MHFSTQRALLIAAGVLILAGCATGPFSGKKDMTFFITSAGPGRV